MCLVLSSHYDIGPVYASYIFIFRQTVFILRQTEFILRQTVFILRQNRVHSSPKPLSIAETRVHASPNRVSNKTCSLFPSVRRDVLSARNLLVGAIPQYWLSLGELLYWPSLGAAAVLAFLRGLLVVVMVEAALMIGRLRVVLDP
jgi:hypothetical protein